MIIIIITGYLLITLYIKLLLLRLVCLFSFILLIYKRIFLFYYN